MTAVYLAYSSGGAETLRRHAWDEPVDLLVAYPMLKQFLKHRSAFNIRRWVLDSGAFSVFNSGQTINVDDYIAAARDVDAAEVFGLDVIGDPLATRTNLTRMWEAGIAAIPTFHRGSDKAELLWCAEHSPKIALGGVARVPGKAKLAWLQACMALVWPKKVHGFGCAATDVLEAMPFHSVDASSWIYAPSKMGAWAGFTGRQVPLRARGIKDFWLEVTEHQKRGRAAASRWRKELSALEVPDAA